MLRLPPPRYVDGGRGQIGYQVVGDGPLDLVYLTGATSHVDVRWDLPQGAAFLRRLASFSRLIMFDRRGTGISDRTAADALPTWEEWVDDLRVVLDEVGSERAALFAVLDAGPMAMLFAASHPARTSALVLGNTSARYVAAPDWPCGLAPDLADLILDGIGSSWGTEAAAVAASPSLAGDPASQAWLARYMRASASPRATAAQWRALFEADFRHVLPSIRVPTLVLSRTSYVTATLAMGRALAEGIEGATFEALPGGDSLLYTEGSEEVLRMVQGFLTGAPVPAEPTRVLVTTLFTDIVGSTRMAAALGDATWRRTLDQHDAMVRRVLDQHGGRFVKATGDGVLATVDAPGRAIRCALALREGARDLGLVIRAGLHTGEVELRGDDIGGISVNIAARVAAAAGPEEVLVSRTVVDLVAGSPFGFVDRGEHELRGVPGSWRLLAVTA